jgi:chemotaxis response regulator CheB
MLKRILVVDDSATFRDAIRSSLENQTGFEVCGEAVDGAAHRISVETTRTRHPPAARRPVPR